MRISGVAAARGWGRGAAERRRTLVFFQERVVALAESPALQLNQGLAARRLQGHRLLAATVDTWALLLSKKSSERQYMFSGLCMFSCSEVQGVAPPACRVALEANSGAQRCYLVYTKQRDHIDAKKKALPSSGIIFTEPSPSFVKLLEISFIASQAAGAGVVTSMPNQ